MHGVRFTLFAGQATVNPIVDRLEIRLRHMADLLDRQGRVWRLSGLLSDGERLVDEFVGRCGREDLAAWIDAQGIRSKMGRAALRIRIGYAVVLVVISAGLGFYVR